MLPWMLIIVKLQDGLVYFFFVQLPFSFKSLSPDEKKSSFSLGTVDARSSTA